MLGFVLLAVFLASGCTLMDALLRRQGRMTRLWLGLSCGFAMMMWFPSLFAFALDFTWVAQALGAGVAVGLGAFAQVKARFRRDSDLQEAPRSDREPPVWLVLALVVPFTLLMGYLQYTHTLRPVDGSLHVGQSTYGDLNLHLGIATGLKNASYPPEYTILPGTLLGYPFLMDALSGSMYLCGTPLRWAFIVPGTLMSALVFWGYLMLAWRLTGGGKRATALSFVLLFLNGGLGFCYVLDQAGLDPSRLISCLNDFYKAPANLVDKNIRWVNVIVDMMLPQRTLLAGWMMVIPALWMLQEAVSSGERKWFWLLGAWGGAMPMIHTHSFLALGLISAGVMAYTLAEEKNPAKKRRLLAGFLCYGGLAVLLAAPQLLTWSVPQTVKGGSLRFQFNWVNWNGGGLIDGYFWFWIKNVGPVYLFLLPGALFAKKRGRAFALGAGLVWLVAELILFQPNVYDNNKLFYVAYMTLLPLAATYLVALYDRMRGLPGRRLLAGVFAIVCVLSGALSVAREVRSDYQLYSAEAVQAAHWLDEHAPQDAVVLTSDNHNNAVSSLAGRKIVCGTASFLYYHGVDYSAQRSAQRAMFEQPGESAGLFSQYGVDYIYISGYERANYAVDEETIANSYPLVYENDEVKLYAVSSRAVGRLSLHPLATAG